MMNPIHPFRLIYLLMFLSPFAAAAQSCSPVKIYAFSHPFIPGNAIAEDKPGGRPEDRIFIYQVYLEVSCSQPPVIPVAWIKGKSYTASVSAVEGNRATTGVPEGKDEAVIINASGKNYLYLVEFQEEPKQRKLPVAYAHKIAADKIWLQMVVNGKTRMLQTPPVQLLQPREVY